MIPHFPKLLPKSFYLSQDVSHLAQSLLGKIVFSKKEGLVCSGIIVETEAYRAPEDKASHAFGNRKTTRTASMFSEGGHAYVYKCYGIHDMLNVVSAEKDLPHAILIRAIEPLNGLELMQQRRNCGHNNYLLTGGPGKVCSALGIDVLDDGSTLYKNESLITIHHASDISTANIVCTPRVGMSHHTGDCGHWPLRFYIKGNKWVSRPLTLSYDW